LQAFRALPQAVRAKLAKSCQAASLPAGAIVFEEDQKADAMYVVLSGSCQVRARPLKDASLQETAAAASAAVAVQEGLQELQVAASSDQQQRQRRSTEEVAAYGGVQHHVGLRGNGARRTTWEGAAFTAQEQAKLEAVRAALDANKQQVRG
jgi:hypothetical protein